MLQRRPAAAEDSPSLGELLVEKANRGVQVLLLVWDDTTNNSGLHSGVMATHDQETKRCAAPVAPVTCPVLGMVFPLLLLLPSKQCAFAPSRKTIIIQSGRKPVTGKKHAAPCRAAAAAAAAATTGPVCHRYFQDTEVVCVLCPRQGGDSDSYLQYFQRGTMFTHHQKTLIVDSPIPAGTPTPTIHGVVPNKRVLAFVGGLDLTNGRYDDHTHPLFDTIAPGGPHEKDMYQGCVDGENCACLPPFLISSEICHSSLHMCVPNAPTSADTRERSLSLFSHTHMDMRELHTMLMPCTLPARF
jgi:hypothetical protein